MARTKKLNPDFAWRVPQNYEEATQMVAQIGQLQREQEMEHLAYNEQIDKLKAMAAERLAPLIENENAAVEALQQYCAVNRGNLTKGSKIKHHQFATGKISWRNRPAKVTLRGKDNIIEVIKRLGLKQFLRISEDVNKEAMLADAQTASTISGVTIGSAGEDFVVEPDNEQIAAGEVA